MDSESLKVLTEFIPTLELLKNEMTRIRDIENKECPQLQSNRPWLYADCLMSDVLLADAVDCIQTAIDSILDITEV